VSRIDQLQIILQISSRSPPSGFIRDGVAERA